jgi:hypothetical protein
VASAAQRAGFSARVDPDYPYEAVIELGDPSFECYMHGAAAPPDTTPRHRAARSGSEPNMGLPSKALPSCVRHRYFDRAAAAAKEGGGQRAPNCLVIDLHGQPLANATAKVEHLLDALGLMDRLDVRFHGGAVIRLVTGQGLHSPNGHSVVQDATLRLLLRGADARRKAIRWLSAEEHNEGAVILCVGCRPAARERVQPQAASGPALHAPQQSPSPPRAFASPLPRAPVTPRRLAASLAAGSASPARVPGPGLPGSNGSGRGGGAGPRGGEGGGDDAAADLDSQPPHGLDTAWRGALSAREGVASMAHAAEKFRVGPLSGAERGELLRLSSSLSAEVTRVVVDRADLSQRLAHPRCAAALARLLGGRRQQFLVYSFRLPNPLRPGEGTEACADAAVLAVDMAAWQLLEALVGLPQLAGVGFPNPTLTPTGASESESMARRFAGAAVNNRRR